MNIIFENDALLVVNKPAGILVHGDGKSTDVTVADWVLDRYPELAGVGEPMTVQGIGGARVVIARPGIVHRLDKDTSGCLLIAKNQTTFTCLKEQFQQHTVAKEYHAFVYGDLKKISGKIDAPIGRSPNDFRRYTASRGKRGTVRDAVTLFTKQGRFTYQGESYSFVALAPVSGRTHQLRVHMQYIHHPIVSDSLYAPKKPQALSFERQALHARTITFKDTTNTEYSVTAPYPQDFTKALSEFLPDLLDL